MNPEDIKVGDKINIEALVIRTLHGKKPLITCELPTGLQLHIWHRDFEALSPANGIKSAKNALNYDPCRRFRKGDIVEPCSVKGRWLSEAWKNRVGIHFTVVEDEYEDGTMWVKDPDSIEQGCVDCIYFLLVTPVEEQEPYSVHETDAFDIMRDGKIVMTIPFTEDDYYTFEQAKAAAEAERDRLNAEHRKEREK